MAAGLGAVGGVYLAGVKGALPFLSGAALPLLSSSEGGGCSSVLQSAYSEIYGMPLPLLGAGAYAATSGLAFLASKRGSPSSAESVEGVPEDAEGGEAADSATSTGTDTARPATYTFEGAAASTGGDWLGRGARWGVLGGATLLSSVSTGLMATLVLALDGQSCPWCFTSAFLSFTVLGLALFGFRGSGGSLAKASGPMGGLGLSVLIFLGVGFKDAGSAEAEITELSYKAPAITTHSSEEALRVSKALNASGAKMYGAFWCSHCAEQKLAFGQEAMATFPYVECFPEGWQKGSQGNPACNAAGVKAFPTWKINGQVFEGEQTFEQLEKALEGSAEPQPAN